jgi:hypothetical protein
MLIEDDILASTVTATVNMGFSVIIGLGRRKLIQLEFKQSVFCKFTQNHVFLYHYLT